jgi:hypothetical protein
MVHAMALSVILHLSNPAGAASPIVSRAQAEVTRVFRDIGVAVEWPRVLSGSTLAGDQPYAIHVVLVPYETGVLQQRRNVVMGAAVITPQGTKIAYVFYRRVVSEAAQHDVSPAFVLACAIAHEVGHLLLPDGFLTGHSSAGLMRPSWNGDDFHRADRGQLRFLPEQASRIRGRLQAPPGRIEEQRGDSARQ